MTEPARSTPRSFAIVRNALLLAIAVLVFGSCALIDPSPTSTPVVWLIGAGALGLLSGFTTGASEETGAGSELLKFVAGAIVTPLLGSMVSLTSAGSPGPTPAIHPLWALGVFFTGFCGAAVVGILLGVLLRKQGGFAIKTKRGF